LGDLRAKANALAENDEALLEGHRISAAIGELDDASFAQNVRGWLEGLAYMLDKEKRGDFDPLTPNRGEIPRLKTDDFARSEIEASAFEANLGLLCRFHSP
jgi:hypothetical protein